MAAVCLSSVLAAGCGGKNQAETLPAQSSETMSVQVSETVEATEETAEQQSVGTEGMTPVLASELRDGVYQIQVDSSSSMFRIEACELTVNDGRYEDGRYRLSEALHGNRGRSGKGAGGEDDPI